MRYYSRRIREILCEIVHINLLELRKRRSGVAVILFVHIFIAFNVVRVSTCGGNSGDAETGS